MLEWKLLSSRAGRWRYAIYRDGALIHKSGWIGDECDCRTACCFRLFELGGGWGNVRGAK